MNKIKDTEIPKKHKGKVTYINNEKIFIINQRLDKSTLDTNNNVKIINGVRSKRNYFKILSLKIKIYRYEKRFKRKI